MLLRVIVRVHVLPDDDSDSVKMRRESKENCNADYVLSQIHFIITAQGECVLYVHRLYGRLSLESKPGLLGELNPRP